MVIFPSANMHSLQLGLASGLVLSSILKNRENMTFDAGLQWRWDVDYSEARNTAAHNKRVQTAAGWSASKLKIICQIVLEKQQKEGECRKQLKKIKHKHSVQEAVTRKQKVRYSEANT